MQKQTKRSKSHMRFLHSMSFTTRMLVLILILLIITTITFMLITQYEVERTIRHTINASIKDMRQLISLYVDNQYRSLVFHKENVLNLYKQKLKDLTDIALANVQYFHQLAKKNILSEEDAREFALRSIEQFRYGNNDYFFVYDKDNVAIAHPDPEIRGSNMTEYQDLKSNYPLKLIRETILEKGKGYNSFWYMRLEEEKPIEKLTYSTYYEPWEWIIGTGFYIDDLEKEYKESLDEMLSEFRKTFSKIRIGTNGYFFIFNKNHIVLVHPTMDGMDFTEVDVPGMGMEHWYSLERASKNPDVPHTYYWDKPGHIGNFVFKKIAYVDYFEPLNWYIVSTYYEDELNEPVKNIFRKELFTALAAILISGILTYFLVKKFTRPVKVLTAHARNLIRNNFVSDDDKDLIGLSKRSNDELSNLAVTFIKMEERLQKYIHDLKETTAAKEKIQSELRIAHKIQMGMLPSANPDFASNKNLSLKALLEPAREVGGDLYDYFFLNDDHLCFLIGDVSDKGVPAALFMARSKSLIRSTAMLLNKDKHTFYSSSEILNQVNAELCMENTHCMFLTIIIGIINIKNGNVTLSNAGHNPPFLVREKTWRILNFEPRMPIGVRPHTNYTDHAISLKNKDCIFLYTDGVTEAINEAGEFFSEKILEKTLRKTESVRPDTIINHVMKEVRMFVGKIPQADDITMICLQYNPDKRKD